MSTSMEREASRPINRPPRVEMTDGRKGSVLIERHQKQGADPVHGRLVDLSRGGVKIAVDCAIPFDETITLSADFPEIDVEFGVLADVLWSRQVDGSTWMIGCSFKPGLPNATVDKLANEGYLERRCSPRYPISCEGAVRWELSDHSVPVRVADFSAEGFCIVSPNVAKAGERLQLELKGNDGEPVRIAARKCWHSNAEDGYLVGAEFLNRNDSHRLWEIAYQTSPNQPLRLRVPLAPSRWMVAWFAALIAVIIAYPPLVQLLTQQDSVAGEWPSSAAAVVTDGQPEPSTRPAAASEPPPHGTNTSAPSKTDVQSLPPTPATASQQVQSPAGRATAERPIGSVAAADSPSTTATAMTPEGPPAERLAKKRSWQAYQQRQQAQLDKRTRELTDQAVQLTRREVAMQAEYAQWARRLQRRQRDIESQRLALRAEQSAWTDQRRARIEADRTATSSARAASAQPQLDVTASAQRAAAVRPAPPLETIANSAAAPKPTPATAVGPPPIDATDPVATSPAESSSSAPAEDAASVAIVAPATPITAPKPATTPDLAAPNVTPTDVTASSVTRPRELADPTQPAADTAADDVVADSPQRPSRVPAAVSPISPEADSEAALAALRRGRRQLEAGRYADATAALQEAVAHRPQSPLGYYLLALAHHLNGDQAAAEQNISTGARLELQQPIADWGRAMQRCQGRPRLWLERARNRAKKDR